MVIIGALPARSAGLAREDRGMSRRLKLGLILSALLCADLTDVVAMPADAQNPGNAASVLEGRRAARRYCSRCHATGVSGRSPKAQAPPFGRIAERYRAKPVAGTLFIDGTIVRHPGMPQFEIPIVEADALIAYIRSLARRNP
jgi:mono/diheme cytochrome c family protein